MRESQYANRYIDSGYTIGTFIHNHVAHCNRWSAFAKSEARQEQDREDN